MSRSQLTCALTCGSLPQSGRTLLHCPRDAAAAKAVLSLLEGEKTEEGPLGVPLFYRMIRAVDKARSSPRELRLAAVVKSSGPAMPLRALARGRAGPIRGATPPPSLLR